MTTGLIPCSRLILTNALLSRIVCRMLNSSSQKAWVVAVDMGYGHERPAYALRHLAKGNAVIIANNYAGIPKSDRSIWEKSRKFYEVISRLKPTPIIGDIIFEAMDKFQEIPSFYPRRDLSRPTLQLRQMYALIRHHDYGRHLIAKLSQNPGPLVTTFFLPAFFAEEYDYPGDIYCVVTDTDISRTWAGLDPRSSRIKYFAPTARVVERLRLYGVRSENIFLTGFPLPHEMIDGPTARVLKTDLSSRLCNLDPHGIFLKRYHAALRANLEKQYCVLRSHNPLTLTFSVGGAGAQKQLGVEIAKGLRAQIRRRKIALNLVCGVRDDVAQFFRRKLATLGFGKRLQKNLAIVHYKNRHEYFTKFPLLLRKTDILWTKPSEMSFYAGLGIPIVIAPPIGSQEEFNRLWLQQMGAGVDQLDPHSSGEWLLDWVQNGALARMAWNGYIEAPTHGAFRIQEVITGVDVKLEELPFIV